MADYFKMLICENRLVVIFGSNENDEVRQWHGYHLLPESIACIAYIGPIIL